MDREVDLFEGQPVLDRQRRLGDEVGRARADDVRAEQLARLRVGNDLHETFRLAQGQRATSGGEWKPPDLHRDAFFPRLFLAKADVGDLGVGVDAVRRRAVVGNAIAMAGDVLHRAHAFV